MSFVVELLATLELAQELLFPLVHLPHSLVDIVKGLVAVIQQLYLARHYVLLNLLHHFSFQIQVGQIQLTLGYRGPGCLAMLLIVVILSEGQQVPNTSRRRLVHL